ncbi:MAG: TPM domain-containing protein [Dysgonamonadaceae bacterium]
MLNKVDLDKVSDAIKNAENRTSAEIRVCVARKCEEDPLNAAAKKFRKLKMYKTKLRNSVLIYVAPVDHKAAILGDIGINEAASEGFWDDVLEDMFLHFRNNEIVQGICEGVGKVGALINARYPIMENDENELSNEVIQED